MHRLVVKIKKNQKSSLAPGSLMEKKVNDRENGKKEASQLAGEMRGRSRHFSSPQTPTVNTII